MSSDSVELLLLPRVLHGSVCVLETAETEWNRSTLTCNVLDCLYLSGYSVAMWAFFLFCSSVAPLLVL